MNFGDPSGMGYLQPGGLGSHPSGHSQGHHSQSGGGSKSGQTQQGGYGMVSQSQDAPGQSKGKDMSRSSRQPGGFGVPNQYMPGAQGPFMGTGVYNP